MEKTVKLFIAVLIWTSLVLPVTAEAQGGVAISGSFYRHHFQMLAGESLVTPNIYVMIFNQDSREANIKLTSQAPAGVEIILSSGTEFSIPPKGERKAEVGVRISPQAIPGEYNLVITAEVKKGGEGIVINSAAQQQARLTIFGEAGAISLRTVNMEGEQFRAQVYLYQKVNGQLSPSGYSPNGELSSRLVPGNYMVQAFQDQQEVAKEEFAVKANETKEVVLVAKTVLIQGFSVVPAYDEGRIVFAKAVYAIKTIQPLKNVKTDLRISLDGKFLEETEMIALPSLDVGVMDGSYKYSPARWQSGTYTFVLEVYSGGKLYSQSPVQELPVAIPTPPSVWIYVVIAILAFSIVLVLLGVLLKKKGRKEN